MSYEQLLDQARPNFQVYQKDNKALTVKDIFGAGPEDLNLFFNKGNRERPLNKGECRQTLNLLRDCGYIEGLLRLLDTGYDGIVGSKDDILRRRQVFGENSVVLPSITPFRDLYAQQFEDKNIILLIVAASVYLVFSFFSSDVANYIQILTIYVGIVFATLVSALADYHQNKSFLGIRDEINNAKVIVHRGPYGQQHQISIKELVVGDVIQVNQGDVIPADCILTEEMNVRVDEQIYGSNEYVEKGASKRYYQGGDLDNHKDNPDNCLLNGTSVMTGGGKALVCSVGTNTLMGRRRKQDKVQLRADKTHLEEKLEECAEQISKYCFMITFAIAIVAIINLFVQTVWVLEHDFWSNATLLKVIKIWILCICVLIVAIPDGMPIAISLAMALSIQGLKKNNILIKKLEAIQMCGMVHDVCISKSGTLTQEKMSANMIHFKGSKAIDIKDVTTQYQNQPNFLANYFKTKSKAVHEPYLVDLMMDVLIGGTSSWLDINDFPSKEIDGFKAAKKKTDIDQIPVFVPKGDNIENATLQFLMDAQEDVMQMMNMRNKFQKVLCRIPFSSRDKFKITAITLPEEDKHGQDNRNYCRVILQGAAEIVVGFCQGQLDEQCQPVGFSQQDKEHVIRNIIGKQMASEGLIPVAYAYKNMAIQELNQLINLQGQESDEFQNNLLRGLTYVCTFGLENKLRDNAKESINLIRFGQKNPENDPNPKSQVSVRMVSGDHIDTCRNIAGQAGIVNEKEMNSDNFVMTGEQFRNAIGGFDVKTNEETGERQIVFEEKEKMKSVIHDLKVIARATDEDKNILVACIKRANGFVLMSGDGINDTEALQSADVGVSMGTSCQVTKDSADLVIMDNDIKSIYFSIMWGRTIYENVRKFIQFQMTMNIAVVTLVFLSCLVMGLPPFNVIHLLWMNLVMDVLAAISICTEPFDTNPKREKENSKLKRISRKDNIFNTFMWRNILPMAVFQIVVITVLMFLGQLIFFDPTFDIIKTQPFMKSEKTGKMEQTGKMDLNTLCFNTFLLMNIFNLINCRVNTDEINIFANIINNMYFWLVVIFEFGVQVAFIWFTKNETIATILYTTSQSFPMILTAWITGAMVLPIRALFVKVLNADSFKFITGDVEKGTKGFNLEKDQNRDNCITRMYARIFRLEIEKEPEEKQEKRNDDRYMSMKQ